MSIPVNKTLDEIRNDLFSKISSVQQDGYFPTFLNLNKGVIRGMIEIWAWGLFQLYTFLALVLKQAFASTATGAWLDLHCKDVGVTRLSATKALGKVIFTRLVTEENTAIPAGRIMKTKPDGLGNIYRFVTTEAVVIVNGQTSVTVSVKAEEYGTAANVVSGQICEIATYINGIDSVTNNTDWLASEGADEEDDEALRQRYYLAWSERNGVTKYAYESWARRTSGVIDVRIMDQHPRGQGTVDVIIKSTAGIPTQQLLDAVIIIINKEQPINDDVEVKAPSAVNADMNFKLELLDGDEANIISKVTVNIDTLIANLEIGEDLTKDRLTQVIMTSGNGSIKKIIWTTPENDISVADMALVVKNSLNITTSWAYAA